MPDAEAVYDAIAEAWVRTRSGPWPAVTGFVGAIARGALMVDLGAGSGRYLAVKEADGLRLVGVDVSRGQLGVARRLAPRGAALLRGDARALPLRSETADAALCIAVVHHFAERAARVKALGEARRVLRGGGRALVSAWGADAEVFASARRLEGGGPQDFLVPFRETLERPVERFFHAYEAGELEEEAREAGFGRVRGWTERENRFAACVR